MVYVLKYDAEEVKLVPMPYHVPADVAEGNDLILY
jgi:syntaxin-binding protein 5